MWDHTFPRLSAWTQGSICQATWLELFTFDQICMLEGYGSPPWPPAIAEDLDRYTGMLGQYKENMREARMGSRQPALPGSGLAGAPEALADEGVALSASELFRGAGLLAPPVPQRLAATFVRHGDWFFATRDPPGHMYNVAWFAAEVATALVDDYVAVAHAGHGVNSYAISYALVYGPLAIFTQCGWGGVYMDQTDSTHAVNEMFELCSALIKAVDQLEAATRPAPARLIVLDDQFTGAGGFCTWLESPFGSEAAARDWIRDNEAAGRAARQSVHLPTWPNLRRALELLSPDGDDRSRRLPLPLT